MKQERDFISYQNNRKKIGYDEFKLRKKFESRQINSYYFDTPFLKDFIDSEEGTVPRKKLRFRWYGKKKTKIGNFEIKITDDLVRKKEKIKIENFDL